MSEKSQHNPKGNTTPDLFQKAMQTSNLEKNRGGIKYCLPFSTLPNQVKKEFVENSLKEDNRMGPQTQTAISAIQGTGDVLSGACVFPPAQT